MPRSALPVLLVPLVLGLAACAVTPPVVPASTPVVTASPTTPSPTPVVTPTVTPTQSATPTTSPTAPAEQSLELRGDGLGSHAFGSKQADVSTVLEGRLGQPDESSQGIKCELDDASPWAQTVSWGAFWVEYDAKDASKKSPRTLAAWGFTVKGQLPDPLTVQDNVPLNLTFAQLKAKYPKGKTQDLGLGDGSKRFILPNKIYFVGAGARPTHVQAGVFSTCE